MTVELEAVELVQMRSRGYCESSLSPHCTGNGEHLHHRQLRSRGGKDLASNLVHICHQCHTFIHSSPGAAKSKERGWLVSSWLEPCEVPVRLYRRGWVLLDMYGGATRVNGDDWSCG